MTRPVRDEEPTADLVAYNDTLHARREKFLAESSAEYDLESVDADEIAQLLAEARRR
ncbi:hypothetical protein [Nocardioides terrisoli]|uniref:hypothetical protein n=1 Tax=Nocardioides terrisoli TaxID=3388267 RepID=UPI00287BBE86|nr:hypothetical protein [Nocardioides marmorisolisilvae]